MIKHQKQQLEYDANVKSCVQIICLKSGVLKQIAGTHDLTFTDGEMREWVEGSGFEGYVHAALQSLVSDGLALETDTPGRWQIEWSNPSRLRQFRSQT